MLVKKYTPWMQGYKSQVVLLNKHNSFVYQRFFSIAQTKHNSELENKEMKSIHHVRLSIKALLQ